MIRRPAVLAISLLIDAAMGDPPNRYHPTAWMGSAINAGRRRAPRQGAARQFAFGALLAAGGAAGVAALGAALSTVCQRMPAPLGIVAEAVALKTTFSWRGLNRAGREVAAALPGDLPTARRRLSWHLVSRDTTSLDESQVAAATVESVAENTSDSIIAPLFYYTCGGLPAALAYRYLNTGDAMLGYHDAEREWLGKAPARLDDLANLAPARLTALSLMAGAALAGADARQAWTIWRRDAGQTASPNAGHPMSAMAGALGVELEKVGHYTLGAGLRRAAPADIDRSLRLANTATLLAAGSLIGLSLVTSAMRTRPTRRTK